VTVRAGAATADITPGVGVAMGGYGARQGVSTGTIDALLVRAAVLSDGEREIAIAVCDLIGVGPDLVRAARELIEADTGIPGSQVLIAATHTHSGPAGIRTRDAAEYVAVTARKIAGAVIQARAALTPVTLKLGTVEVTTISQNRRHPDGPIETTAKVVLAAPCADSHASGATDGGDAVVTLVNYACHSTVLEADNLAYSPDFPGAMCRFVEREVGGTAIYLQGAAGNINPVWMRHDAAEVERVGGILGAAATRAVHELRPLGEGQWCVNLNWSEEVPKAAAGTVLTDVRFATEQTVLELPRRLFPSRDALAKEIKELEAERDGLDAADLDGRRARTARINELRIEWLIAGAGDDVAGELLSLRKLEVQTMRLSAEVGLVALPGEFFVEIGHAIEADAGLPHLLVVGYANGMVGYVPTEEAFAEHGYEVGCAQFEPNAGGLIADAAVGSLHSLYA
jgi:hypothetical protein